MRTLLALTLLFLRGLQVTIKVLQVCLVIFIYTFGLVLGVSSVSKIR